MPDNSSGYIDFNQYSDLNRDEETRMLEEAMARAEAADGRARGALLKANNDAQGSYGPDGQFTGNAETLSKSASYSDYLSAKGDAKAAWAAVTGSSLNLNSDALRDNIRGSMGVGARSGAGAAGLRAAEAQYGQGVSNTWTGINRQRGEQAALAAEKKKATDERAEKDAGYEAAHLQGIKDRVAEAWGRRDRRAKASFGTFAEEGGSKWTNSEIAEMDELGRLSKQNGIYDEMGVDGAWDTDVQYAPSGSPKAGKIGFQAANHGTGRVSYSNDPRMGFMSRTGGFKGFGK